MVDITESPFPQSPVVPVQYKGDEKISFQCYKGISCFNACCKSIDITLTPYDILRLKNRLGLTSREFLLQHAVPFEMEKDGIAGLKLRTKDDSTECQFMTDEGCSVYEDRPTACRYYPVGLISMRKQGESTDEATYALVQEEHCKGHLEDRELTIDEYREEQGLTDYDEHGRGWRQLVLKKKSSGPTVGKPTKRSLQMFFMVCYDLDAFKAFVNSEGFRQTFDISDAQFQAINDDEVALLHFGYDLLRHVMFGEETVAIQPAAREAWEARKRAELEAKQAEEEVEYAGYDPSVEPMEL